MNYLNKKTLISCENQRNIVSLHQITYYQYGIQKFRQVRPQDSRSYRRRRSHSVPRSSTFLQREWCYIHQRIQKLTNLGILPGSQFLIDPEKIGYETCAYIGLYLKNPEDFDRVVEALKKIPEVVECHITTGDYDLFIKIFARNNHHMMDIIHDKLQPLGLSRSKSLISFKTVIDRPLPIEENPNAPQEEDKE